MQDGESRKRSEKFQQFQRFNSGSFNEEMGRKRTISVKEQRTRMTHTPQKLSEGGRKSSELFNFPSTVTNNDEVYTSALRLAITIFDEYFKEGAPYKI